MTQSSTHFRPFYCYVERPTGKMIITKDSVKKTENMEYFYIAACPNEEVAKLVYTRHLAIARW